MKTPAFPEEDLHAYTDGQLPAARASEMAAWLEQDPAHAGDLHRVRAWRAQNRALHAHYDPVLEEPLPPRLAAAVLAGAGEPHRRRDEAGEGAANGRFWWRYAAMLLLTLAGATGGWLAHDLSGGGRAGTLASAPVMLARQAAVAHTVFSADLRRPVEVGADQEQALVTWLSRRLGVNVRAPKLAPLGYDLIGGRLLPGQSGPVAQFMYQDAAGQRLTLYVSHDQVQNSETGFRFAQEGKVNVFYWIDGQFGYALSGGVARAELSRIASSVYEQLVPLQPAPSR
ncbi:anti-sigma factor [Herbaspirillum huttiense F1]|uniref:anti-sigma factor family protein n=1 Tax=Herbaspirillum TaxID=963 RepID=UPI001AEA67EA|nr:MULTISPECIES: anti-sigma factor [Herbaspirillum]MBP1313848.1 anti-sigma factor RsiW [Herbaspirillum sp. 1130]MDT0354880.1 anti-sigma factor [Herbaspirillum huttiense F1]